MEKKQFQNVEDFIAHHRMAIAQNPDCGTSHYNLAVGLLGQKQYEEAEKELFQAIDCSPTLAEAYVMLGGIRLNNGDLDGCLDFNRRAVKMRPGFSEGFGNIGFILLQKGEVDEAIKNLERATRFNFRFIQAFANLANAYLIQGDLDKSIEAGKKALDLDDNFAVAHHNLSIAYLEKGEDALAAEHSDRAVALGYEVPAEIRADIESRRPAPA